MKRLLFTLVAGLALLVQPGMAADRKPLVVVSGQTKQMPAGDTVGVDAGGTGATTASAARTSLGVAIGTNVQAYDADLTTYAGITPSANVQTLLGSADNAAIRSNIGLGTFATQNYATPPAIGGTTPAAGSFTTLSATGNLTTNVTGSTQCLHVNSSGVVSGTGSDCGSGGGGGGSVTSVDVSGGSTGLTSSGGPIISSGTITLAGTLDVDNGGTGQTSYTNGQLLIGNTTGNTLTKATLTAGTGISVTNGGGSITIAAAPDYYCFSETIPSSTGTVTISSLPSGYRDLRITVRGASTQSATYSDLSMRFNSDTGANYDYQQVAANNATNTSTGAVAQTSAGIGWIGAATGPSNTASSSEIVIYDYANTARNKAFAVRGGVRTSTAASGMNALSVYGDWRSTAAITSVTVFLGSGNFTDAVVGACAMK